MMPIKILFVMMCLITTIFGRSIGTLNVFTDLPTARIHVDGLVVGEESIIRMPLEVGEHYVQVIFNNTVVYAETVTIEANRSRTVVSDHFVDIITNTPSRGAIDRESVRVRESRGNIAFGYSFNTLLQDAISIKWWSHPRFGVSGKIGGAISGTNHRGLIGGRVFYSPADKLYKDDIITGTIFLGAGQYSYTNDGNHLISDSYTEFGISIETYIGELVKNFMLSQYSSPTHHTTTSTSNHKSSKKSSSQSSSNTLQDLMIVILTNIGHTTFEVSMVKLPHDVMETSFSSSIHFYF